jgi:hypothetical protein
MRPTMWLRTRNLPDNGPGVIEQLFFDDIQSSWEWRRVPLVPTDSPMKGDSPPPIRGDEQKEMAS